MYLFKKFKCYSQKKYFIKKMSDINFGVFTLTMDTLMMAFLVTIFGLVLTSYILLARNPERKSVKGFVIDIPVSTTIASYTTKMPWVQKKGTTITKVTFYVIKSPTFSSALHTFAGSLGTTAGATDVATVTLSAAAATLPLNTVASNVAAGLTLPIAVYERELYPAVNLAVAIASGETVTISGKIYVEVEYENTCEFLPGLCSATLDV